MSFKYTFFIFFCRFYRAALALLCELSVVNPMVFIEGSGVKALTYCLLDTSMSKIAEAILSSLLRLHNDPNLRYEFFLNCIVLFDLINLGGQNCSQHSVGYNSFVRPTLFFRNKANVNLGMVVAPFTEFSYIHQFGETSSEKIDAIEEKEKRFKCAEQAFLSTMR